MSSGGSRTGRNVAQEPQDKSKCRPGAAGQVEMSSGSMSKCRPGAAGQGQGSKCRPGAAGQGEMSSGGSRTGRNVVGEQRNPAKAGQEPDKNSEAGLQIYSYIYIYIYESNRKYF